MSGWRVGAEGADVVHDVGVGEDVLGGLGGGVVEDGVDAGLAEFALVEGG